MHVCISLMRGTAAAGSAAQQPAAAAWRPARVVASAAPASSPRKAGAPKKGPGGGRGGGGRGGRGGRGGGGRGGRGRGPPAKWQQQGQWQQQGREQQPPQLSSLAVESVPAWRVFGVAVPAEEDPGKDDFSVHPGLLAAAAKKIGCRGEEPLAAEGMVVVRKSFDARTARGRGGARSHTGKCWMYVVDVSGAALLAAGVRRLTPAPGQQETQPAWPPLGSPTQLWEAAGSSLPGGAAAGREDDPVVVVGSGPAGLFAALAMAEAGVKVVLLERGQPVERRGRDIGALFVRSQLNQDSNLCYGEGGAGTWSDGKLTTRIGRNSDPVRAVLAALHRFGAPESVLLSGKPHLGTDRLVTILRGLRAHLLSLGAEVCFGACVTDLLVSGTTVKGVRLGDGSEIKASKVVLAVGHSARATYRCLLQHGVTLTPKPFAMGFRIEHPQTLIDQLQYGEEDAARVQRGAGPFPVAEYRLATEVVPGAAMETWYNPLVQPLVQPASGALPADPAAEGAAAAAGTEHSAAAAGGEGPRAAPLPSAAMSLFSFCMCPGGQVVPTSTNEEELCINGMSFSRRNSRWANSALVVGIQAPEWAHLKGEHGPLAGMALQQQIEREAARMGGGQLVAPVQRAVDFLEGRVSADPLPSSSYRLGVRSAPLHELYAPHITAAFREALMRFERQMPGFAVSDKALLHGAETRTSAPVRIERRSDLQSPSLAGLYPAGEGAGWAGGIVSAAVDGLRVGSAIASELTGQEVGSAASGEYKVNSSY